jgi:hypothetical protein
LSEKSGKIRFVIFSPFQYSYQRQMKVCDLLYKGNLGKALNRFVARRHSRVAQVPLLMSVDQFKGAK